MRVQTMTVLFGKQGGAVVHEPKKLNSANVLQVHLLEAKPNKMFTAEQTAAVRFLHYSHPVECAECGKRSKYHWTSLFSFQAMDFKNSIYVLRSSSGKVHPPLTPVCRTHPMGPAEMPLLPPRVRKKKLKATVPPR